MTHLPIAQYALLSDCKSAALVGKDGSVDWLCFPRFDGPSVFGRILDESAGHWSIRPAGDAEVSRRYVDETMLLETTFRTATGTGALVAGGDRGRRSRRPGPLHRPRGRDRVLRARSRDKLRGGAAPLVPGGDR